MLEIVVLVAQSAAVFFLAAWLSTGFVENVLHPDLNETFTAQVLSMERMREEYPEAYEVVAHRSIENPAIQKFLFKVIVCWECCQTNSNQSQFAAETANLSGTKLTPLAKSGGAGQLEGVSTG